MKFKQKSTNQNPSTTEIIPISNISDENVKTLESLNTYDQYYEDNFSYRYHYKTLKLSGIKGLLFFTIFLILAIPFVMITIGLWIIISLFSLGYHGILYIFKKYTSF